MTSAGEQAKGFTGRPLGEYAGRVRGTPAGAARLLIGSIGSLIVAALWMMLFPGLRHLDRIQPVES